MSVIHCLHQLELALHYVAWLWGTGWSVGPSGTQQICRLVAFQNNCMELSYNVAKWYKPGQMVGLWHWVYMGLPHPWTWEPDGHWGCTEPCGIAADCPMHAHSPAIWATGGTWARGAPGQHLSALMTLKSSNWTIWGSFSTSTWGEGSVMLFDAICCIILTPVPQVFCRLVKQPIPGQWAQRWKGKQGIAPIQWFIHLFWAKLYLSYIHIIQISTHTHMYIYTCTYINVAKAKAKAI